MTQALGARHAEELAHPGEDVRQSLALHVAEGEGHKLAGTHLAAAVDVELHAARATPEILGRFQLRERGENRRVEIVRHLPMQLEHSLVVLRRENRLRRRGQPSHRTRFQQVDLHRAGLFHEAKEVVEGFFLQQ